MKKVRRRSVAGKRGRNVTGRFRNRMREGKKPKSENVCIYICAREREGIFRKLIPSWAKRRLRAVNETRVSWKFATLHLIQTYARPAVAANKGG